MADKANKFKTITIRGRLTYSNLSMAQALQANDRSQFKKTDTAQVAPDVQILVEAAQLDKLRAHIVDVYLPEAEKRKAAGEKRDALDAKAVKKISAKIASGIEDEDWSGSPFLPIKDVYEKSKPLMPTAVATVKATGTKGVDINVKAMVTSEDELAHVDPSKVFVKQIVPIDESVHEMYPGAWVAMTLNLFSYASQGTDSIGAGVNTVVWVGDDDRFGGGVDVDEDEIFLDD